MQAERSGPFGLEAGTPLSSLNTSDETTIGVYRLDGVPRSHPAFESYIATATPTYGLGRIRAIGRNVPSSVYGVEVRVAFVNMLKRLTAIYGEPTEVFDQLLPDSIWNEPRDWMTSLEKGERLLAAEWSVDGHRKLPDRLTSIGLHAAAIDSDSGFLILEYTFDNYDNCRGEIESIEDSAL